jgi:hypothetical protein
MGKLLSDDPSGGYSDDEALQLYHSDMTSAVSFSVHCFSYHHGREIVVQLEFENADSIYRYYWRSVWLYNLLFSSVYSRTFLSRCVVTLSRITYRLRLMPLSLRFLKNIAKAAGQRLRTILLLKNS